MKDTSLDTTILGLSPGAMTAVLAILAGLLVLLVIGSGLSNRFLLRLGVRNMLRRPGHTLLLLCGLMLSTALITASLGLNDSLAYSADAQQLASIGNLDEAVTGTFTQAQVTSYLAALRGHPGIEAAAALAENYHAATLLSPRTGFSLPNVNVLAAPGDLDQAFGPLRASDGQELHFADLHPGQIYLGMTLAQNFAARPGDHLTLSLAGQRTTVTVAGILANDVTVNASEIVFSGQEQLVMPLAQYQQMLGQTGQVNTFAMSNRDHAASPEVVSFLSTLFGTSPASLKNGLSSQPSYVITRLDVIQPDLLHLAEESGLGSFSQGLGSQGDSQFASLLPALTLMMVGAGMLLLALLFILLGSERRAEMGMGRAIGLQRAHLVRSMLIEGGGYGLLAALLGVPVGVGLIALELVVLSHIPLQNILGVKAGGSSFHMLLQVWVSWNSLIDAFCLSLLVSCAVILLVATWISRMNIVNAIRNLANPARQRASLPQLLRACVHPENSMSGNLARRSTAAWGVFWGLCARGPLCLLFAALLLRLASLWSLLWLSQIGLALLVAGVGLTLTWLFTLLRVAPNLASRIGFSLIGLGWLVYGIQPGSPLFAVFQPGTFSGRIVVSGAANAVSLNGSALSLAISDVALIAGAVVLVMANSDLLVMLVIACVSRLPRLTPLSRLSLTYPLTFRFRTIVTVSLLGLVAFLIMLVVTINLGAVQEASIATAAGGFQLSSSGQDLPSNFPQLVMSNSTLRHDLAQVGSMQSIAHSSQYARQVLLPGQQPQSLNDSVAAMDDTFLETTTMPVQARARGYTSDQQVWNALRTHPGYAVWYYEPTVHGLNPNASNFQPFPILVRDQQGRTHRLLVIGIVSPATRWANLYVSQATFAGIYGSPSYTTYLLRVNSGISTDQATQDMMKAFGITYGLQIQSLGASTASATVANLSLFFGCYLALGLLFGVVALGVTMSRAVIERRQQIGMLRALGFSRSLVLCAFLVEAGFITTLSLFIGGALALWTAYQVTSSLYPDFPLPLVTLLLILLGCYIVTFLATALPARHAARVRPAEALRYE